MSRVSRRVLLLVSVLGLHAMALSMLSVHPRHLLTAKPQQKGHSPTPQVFKLTAAAQIVAVDRGRASAAEPRAASSFQGKRQQPGALRQVGAPEPAPDARTQRKAQLQRPLHQPMVGPVGVSPDDRKLTEMSPLVAPAVGSPATSSAVDGDPQKLSYAATPRPGATNRAASAEPCIPTVSAAHTQNKPPTYPVLSRQLGEQGDVLVRVWIEPSGSARDGSVLSSSGHSRLDQAGLMAALSWRYAYASCVGQVQSGWLQVPVSFRLGG